MTDTTRSGRSGPLSDLAASGTALLTTFRPSGQPVATPVSIAVDGDLAYFTTAADSGKARRLASNDAVTVAPCTTNGTITVLPSPPRHVGSTPQTTRAGGVCFARPDRCSGATCSTGSAARPCTCTR